MCRVQTERPACRQPSASGEVNLMSLPDPPLRRRSWRKAWLPPLPFIPAMTNQTEQQMFYWLTSSRYTGAGAVVELGCWLGAGTVALAAGLRDRGLSSRVFAIDRFVWKGNPNSRVVSAGLADGDDFEPLFRKYTQALAPWIEPLRVDLSRLQMESWTDRNPCCRCAEATCGRDALPQGIRASSDSWQKSSRLSGLSLRALLCAAGHAGLSS